MAVRALTNADRIIDTYTPITASFAAWLAAHGYTVVGRYLDNLTVAEVACILGQGLGLFGIRTSRAYGWFPTAEAGALDGADMVARATALEVAEGTTLTCDFEGCALGTTVQDATAYMQTCAEPLQGRWPVMQYVGAQQPLNGVQLGALVGVSLYWRSCSRVPEVPCGYALLQTRPGNVSLGPAGAQVLVDIDQAETDWHTPARSVTAMFR